MTVSGRLLEKFWDADDADFTDISTFQVKKSTFISVNLRPKRENQTSSTSC